MREIKFRAWDRTKQKMHYQSRFAHFSDFYIKLEGGIRMAIGTMSDAEVKDFEEKTDNQPSIILMQFTGLSDRNGMEIYEGDIISFHKKKKPIGVVEFDKFRGFCLKWDASTAKIRDEILSDGMPGNLESKGSPWELIGNIYENPELLGGTK